VARHQYGGTKAGMCNAYHRPMPHTASASFKS
jgi:hypothetical protein